MINILSVFNKQVHYPNNLADGFKSGVIYHGVSKNFMSGMSAFTSPLLAIVLERNNRIIEQKRCKYLHFCENHNVPVSKLDDFILISESHRSYWIFTVADGENVGSIGNISKHFITANEFVRSVQNNIKKITKCTRRGSLTGEYMLLPTKNKVFCFHE